MSDHETHPHGLLHDLEAMRALASRRRVLSLFAGTSAVVMLAGCGGDDSDSGVTVVDGGTPTPTPTATSTPTPTPTSSGNCVADPAETNGPYPADGTNTSSGSTSNVLTVSGVVRSDVRSSFIGSTTTATGVELELTLTVVDSNSSCAALSGYAVYIWLCDANGDYSLYTLPKESYLRGVQVTDANGQVTFTAIFPGCYMGRWPHIHFEVYSSLSYATSQRYAVLTSQLAMPEDVCDTVYADTSLYPQSATNMARVTLSSDNVFNTSTSAQLAQQTPTLTGSVSAGYKATATIGIAT